MSRATTRAQALQSCETLSHAEVNLKRSVVATGPSCLLHLGILESPDYWTDNALVEAAMPATKTAWKPWADWTSEQDKRQQQPNQISRTANEI